ncbi:MAG: hypothetical protein GX601_05350 [Anaerolineales bacterium]|nr:hypothetical protein [Anaerolineales bacterium]
MKRPSPILVSIVMLVLATLACFPNRGAQPTATPEQIQPTAVQEQVQPTVAVEVETPAPTVQPTSAPSPVPQGASIEISNESDVDVYYIYISPSDSGEWGEDWLGDQVLPAGGATTIYGVPEGTCDIKAADQAGEIVEVFWEVDLAGAVSWTITGTASLVVDNQSTSTITNLYISSTESDTWGDNWLTTDVVGPGETYVVSGIPRGSYDIKATASDNSAIEVLFNVQLVTERTWTVQGSYPLPSNAVLRFEDDFSSNRNNWGRNVDTGDVLYNNPADGQFCIDIRSQNFTAWEWYEPFRPDQFVAEIMCTVTGPADATCGLGFGPDGDNLYWFEVTAYNQAFALFLLENGSWQTPPIEWTESVNISPQGPNYLSMERVQGQLNVFINGVLVGQVASDRFPTGRVGIGGSTYDDGNATVCIDSLQVWRLE